MLWEIWRVWLSGFATLEEIETKWSLCDVLDANAALDIQIELQKEIQPTPFGK